MAYEAGQEMISSEMQSAYQLGEALIKVRLRVMWVL
jgi:hypothetical protein